MELTRAQQLRREKLGKIHAEMMAIVDLADKESRALTEEENTRWDKFDAEYKSVEETIKRLEVSDTRTAELNALDTRAAGRQGDNGGNNGGASSKDEERALVERAFGAFLRQSPAAWTPEIAKVIQSRHASLADVPGEQLRALGLTGAAGGFTVPQEFMDQLERAQKSFSGMLQASRIINTASGAALPWPSADDTGNTGALLAEGDAAGEQDVVFAATQFDAFVYTSKLVRVANQLLTDTGINLEGELSIMLGERLGRILNTHATTGTGSSQPRGLITGLLADTTPIAAAGPTALVYEDLVDVQHGVDPAYRPQGSFMFHDTVLKIIKKLKDGDLRPLWSAGLQSRDPSTILGHPFFINQDMDSTLAAAAESIVFGDFSKYVIRRVMGAIMVRLSERYAEFFQTGFVMFARWDSDLVAGAHGPLQVLQH